MIVVLIKRGRLDPDLTQEEHQVNMMAEIRVTISDQVTSQ